MRGCKTPHGAGDRAVLSALLALGGKVEPAFCDVVRDPTSDFRRTGSESRVRLAEYASSGDKMHERRIDRAVVLWLIREPTITDDSVLLDVRIEEMREHAG
jgi:hypothetical protein